MSQGKNIYGFWSKEIVTHIVVFMLLTVFVNWYLFYRSFIPWSFVLAGVAVGSLFFISLNWLLHRWMPLQETVFLYRLFVTSLVLRVCAVVFLYFLFTTETGVPFEYNAVDSLFYHRTAIKIAEHFSNGDFNVMNYTPGISFSDLGFNVYLGAIYTLFGPSLLISRLIGALISSFTVVLIYRIAKNIDPNPLTTRTAAISAMLLPNFLVYLGTQLKETLMVFLVVAFIHLTISIIRNQNRSAQYILMFLFVLFFLFTIRTVLASIAVASFAGYGLLSNPARRRTVNVVVTILILAAFAYMIINSQIGVEIEEFISRASTSQTDNMRFRAERDYGNKYALLAGAPLFLSVVLIAPFPSFVYVPFQEFIWLFIGGNFIRNIYAFFLIGGIVYAIRHNFRNTSILLFCSIGYLLVLATSPFAISERFHLPAVPGLIILSAMGITHRGLQLRKYFDLYLFLLFVFITAWNYIKLSGRL